jgi:catechol 2,3-dioxygenase-like lactoylglutathione lyase family enzyme
MTRYLHTMYRITDPGKSRAFYEALGLMQQLGVVPPPEP